MGKVVGFRFEHLLNEVAEKPKMMRMMSGRSVLVTVGFNISVGEMATLLDTLLMHSENSPQTTERVNNLINKMKQALIISNPRWDILVGRAEEIKQEFKQEQKKIETKVVQ
jgi:predicted small metal-binding protein